MNRQEFVKFLNGFSSGFCSFGGLVNLHEGRWIAGVIMILISLINIYAYVRIKNDRRE